MTAYKVFRCWQEVHDNDSFLSLYSSIEKAKEYCEKVKKVTIDEVTVPELIALLELEAEGGNYHNIVPIPKTLCQILNDAGVTESQILNTFWQVARRGGFECL